MTADKHILSDTKQAECQIKYRLLHIARVAAPILRAIPHPAAQVAGRIVSLAGRLRFEGASEEEAMADIIRFTQDDEREIRQGAAKLVRGVVPTDLPPRFLVSASRHAIGLGASPPQLSQLVTRHLADVAARDARPESPTLMAA